RAPAAACVARRGLGGRPYGVVHPGSRHIARRSLRSPTGIDKYWPAARWSRVIQALRELKPDHALFLTGTRAERQINAAIIESSGVNDIHNVADELPVPTLLPLLERA